MKDLYIKGISALTAILSMAAISACSGIEGNSGSDYEGPKAVRFFMSTSSPDSEKIPVVPSTRTATDNFLNTSFVKGDAVGIFVYERTEEGNNGELLYKNMEYVYDGSNWTPASGEQIIVESTKKLNYFAYYPYDNALENPSDISRRVSSSQLQAADYNLSDFLMAKNCEVPAGTEIVGLSFRHAMSLVQVRITGTEALNPDITVQLTGVQLEANIDLLNDRVSTTSNQTASVDLIQLDGTPKKMVYRAVIPAQSINADKDFLLVKDGEKYTPYSSPELIAFNCGKARVVNVILGEPTEGISNIDAGELIVDKWEDDETVELQPGETEDVSPEPEEGNLMTLPFSPYVEFKDFVGENWPSGTVSMWWKKSTINKEAPNFAVNFSKHEQLGSSVSVSGATEIGQGIGYYFAEGPYEAARYELSFDAAYTLKNKLNIGLVAVLGGKYISFAAYLPDGTPLSAGTMLNADKIFGADYSGKILAESKLTEENSRHTIIFDLTKQYLEDEAEPVELNLKSFENLSLRFALGTDAGFVISNVWFSKIEE